MNLPALQITDQSRSVGLVRVVSPEETTKLIEQQNRQADDAQADPVVTELGSHIRSAWSTAYLSRCHRQEPGRRSRN